jgi:hypothetical protein
LYAKKHLKKHRQRRCCFCHEIEILHFPDTVTKHIDQNVLRLADQESVGLLVWALLFGHFPTILLRTGFSAPALPNNTMVQARGAKFTLEGGRHV